MTEFFRVFCLTAAITACLATQAAATDQFVFYFGPGITAAGAIGGTTVDSAGNFWAIGNGPEQKIRKIESVGTGWAGIDKVIGEELNLLHRADDLAAGNANSGGGWGRGFGGAANSILLNPKPLSIEVPTGQGGTTTLVYPAESIAFVGDFRGLISEPSGQTRPDLTKKLYRYDLRTVLDPTTSIPDFNTSQDFTGGPRTGAFGVADWNDVFQPVVSEQDLRTQAGSTGGDGFGRQFGWSTDGQTIYAVDSSRGLGGIYRIDATRWANDAGGIARIWDDGDSNPDPDINEPSMRSEPAILATSAFDYAPQNPAVGDQILVEGSFDSGNSGGVNVFVDTGAAELSAPDVLFTEEEFRDFAEYYSTSVPRYNSLLAAPNGDLYIAEQQTRLLFKYDTEGRFVKLFSERELDIFQDSVLIANNNDVIRNLTLRTSEAPGFEVPEIVYPDREINSPVGVLDFLPGDFDRDNDRDAADLEAFAGALGTRNTEADDEFLRFDLNGNESAFRDVDDNNTPTDPSDDIPIIRHVSNGPVVVDWKDVKILQQFAEFPNGDTNFDMTLDFVDLTTMSENYYTEGQTAATWVLGDFASADEDYLFDAADANLVDFTDLQVLADAWVGELGLPAPSDSELAAAFSGQFLTDAIAAFAIDSGLVGDYDLDGDVDEGDYDVWAAAFGETGAGLDADGNEDGVVDAADYAVWRDALVIDPLAADFNADGVVDSADYTVWRDTLGQTGDGLAADANGDRVVDRDDYDRWVAAFGAVAPPGAAVPEPGALLLALVGGTLLASRRR